MHRGETSSRAESALVELDLAIGTECCATEAEPAPVVIVHAPRAGSTLLYQMLIHGCVVDFLPNLVNDETPEQPLVGLAIRSAVAPRPPVSFSSRFGKTDGRWGPSEASAVHAHWFGGGHPSELVSSEFPSPAAVQSMQRTLVGARRLSGAELVLKNAWNSFRIRAIAEALPEARFVWLRRSVVDAAVSDLRARHQTKGDLHAWNSATPAGVDRLRALPPWQQVVENQLAFAASISAALADVDPRRWAAIWYEDLVDTPEKELVRLCDQLALPVRPDARATWASIERPNDRADPPEWLGESRSLMEAHVAAQRSRYAPVLREAECRGASWTS